MLYRKARSLFPFFSASPAQVAGAISCCALALTLSLAAWGQQDSSAPQAQPAAQPGAQSPGPAPDAAPVAAPADTQSPPPAAQPADSQSAQPEKQPAPGQPAAATLPAAPASAQPGEISEDEVRKILVGKQLFLRGGYLDNSLTFNEHGVLVGHSPQGSYTLSAIQIDKVHLTRHKVELEGERFGLHFLGALPYEDPTKAVDRVNITPKKKVVKITIDRELVVKPKQKKKEGKPALGKNACAQPGPTPAASAAHSSGRFTPHRLPLNKPPPRPRSHDPAPHLRIL